MENEKDLTIRQSEEGPGQNDPQMQATESAATSPDAPAAAGGQGELPADLPAAYRQLLTEKQELYDRLLRKQAELENFRKRSKREKEDFLQHATADLVRALLPTVDAFERALKHQDETVAAEYQQGIELIYRELLEVLGRAGLTPLETVGKDFDPHLHQAVETVRSRAHRDHEIVEELQRGYKLNQRLLRPAIVRVAVAAEDDGEMAPQNEPDSARPRE
jgi:molecular chaperone GrpE